MNTKERFKFHAETLAFFVTAAEKDAGKDVLSALKRANIDAAFLLIAEEQRESAERYGTTLQEFFKEYERQALERYKELNKLFKEVIGE